jgi:hypothetical protein
MEKELRRLSPAQFKHHVNESRNDFYNWILHVVKDKKLAKELSSAKTKHQMADSVANHIYELTKPVIKPGHDVERRQPKPIKKNKGVSAKPGHDVERKQPKPIKKNKGVSAKPGHDVERKQPKPIKKKLETKPVKKKEKIVPKTLPKKIKYPKVKTPKTKPKPYVPELVELPGTIPLPMSFEEVRDMIESKVRMPDSYGSQTPLPVEEPVEEFHSQVVSEKKDYSDAKHDIKKHMIPYILGIMAGVLAGLVLARFFI